MAKKSLKSIQDDIAKLNSQAEKTGQVLEPLTSVAGNLANKLSSVVPNTEELRTALAALDVNALGSAAGVDAARNAFDAFNVATGDMNASVAATTSLLQSGFTSSNLQTAVEGLTGACLKFPGTMNIDALASSLQQTLASGEATGQFAEMLDMLGISASGFAQGLQQCATDAEKQNYILDTLSQGGLMSTYDAWKQNSSALVENKEANAELQNSLSELAETITPILTTVTGIITSLVDGFNNLSPVSQGIILALVAIAAAIVPLIGGIGAVAASVAALNVSMLPVIGVIAGIVAAVVAVIAIIENWDAIVQWFKNTWDTVWTGVKSLWDSVVTGISDKWNNFKNAFIEGWNNIKTSISNTVTGIKDTIWGLITSAWNWGSDFIHGLWDGIKSGVNKVVDCVKGIGEKIRSYLHFSRPDVGPLRDYETWMPDFIDGLVNGIDRNIYKVSNAMKRVSGLMGQDLRAGSGILATSGVPAVHVNNAFTVKIGNKQLDSYIVQASQSGIAGGQISSGRAKGVAYV